MKTLTLLFSLLTFQMAFGTGPGDPKATPETIKLFRQMMQLQEKGMMFGHQDALAYGTSWYAEKGRSDVKDVCGDYPAVFGWELGHLELGAAYSLDSVFFDQIRDGIIFAHERGGINTISWHFRNILTGGTAWDVSSKKVVASMLPGGTKHQEYLKYLDRLADFLASLKDKEGKFIPVFFRPFHEHTGSWFWWGKDLCTISEFKAIWRFTADYLMNTKEIHHVLYAYSSDRFTTAEEYLERYPGDDIIDLIGFDLYDRQAGFSQTLSNCAAILTGIAAEKGKICAVTEAGGPIAKDTQWWTHTLLKSLKPFNLSYVLVWRNPFNQPPHVAFGPYKDCPSEQSFKEFYNDPKTLFLNDINE